MNIFRRSDFYTLPMILGAAVFVSATQLIGSPETGRVFPAAEPEIVSSSQLLGTANRREEAPKVIRSASCTPGFRCSTMEPYVPNVENKKAMRLTMLVGMGVQLKRY